MYIKFLVLFAFTAGIVAVGEVNENLTYISSLILMAAVMYAITYYGDAKNEYRPSWAYRLSCIIGAAYCGYYLYPEVKGLEVNILIYKFHPFATIQIFIAFCSYFAVSFFTHLKGIKFEGWRKYIGKLSDKLKAISEGDKENER